ncbi:MAG: site-specific integrase [Nocardiaceae bacterium]|nr:site-specific integrase [Nocardiaceae bacterium]
MRTHVLPQWGSWQLGKIDHMSVQAWISRLSVERSRATVAEAKRLMSGAMRSAVRSRLIGVDPTVGIRVPGHRVRDTDERILSRDEIRSGLVPAIVPERYQTLVATAAFTGMRWGEVIGLCPDAVDLKDGTVRVIRTVTEVAGHTEFKPFPKSKAGRRLIPLPAWLTEELAEYLNRYPVHGDQRLIFSNEVGGALLRTTFRTRVWRPALVRAGLLGEVYEIRDGFEAVWMGADGEVSSEIFGNHEQAVKHVAKNEASGFRFHDLRHSYGTWLADDGLPPHKIAKVMGHENITTTMQLYVRRTEDHQAIRDLLGGGPKS